MKDINEVKQKVEEHFKDTPPYTITIDGKPHILRDIKVVDGKPVVVSQEIKWSCSLPDWNKSKKKLEETLKRLE